MIQFSSITNKNTPLNHPPEQPLFQPAHLEHKSVAPLRNAFNQWIRSLPMEERFMALKIYSGPIPQVLRKKLAKLQPLPHQRGSEMQTKLQHSSAKEEVSSDSKKGFRKIQKGKQKLKQGFYQSVVLVSDGHQFFDHICFEYGLLECPQKLFQLLTSPVEKPDSKLMHQAIHNHQEIQTVVQKMLASTSVETLFLTTLTYLRQEALLRFRESMANIEFIPRGLEQERRRKKQFSLHLKHLSQDLKRKLVLVGFKDVQQLRQWLLSYGIKISYEQLQKEAEELQKLQKNDFSNRIFKCKLKKSNTELVNYHEQVYNYWKKEVSKYRKKKFNKNNAPEHSQKEFQPISHQYQDFRVNIIHRKKNKLKQKRSVSIQSNQTNVTNATDGDKKVILKRKTNIEVNTSFSRLSPKDQQKMRQASNSKDEGSSFELLQKREKRFNRKRKPKVEKSQPGSDKTQTKKLKIIELQSKIAQLQLKFPTSDSQFSKLQLIKKLPIGSQFLKQISTSIISEQLQNFADKISEEANLYHERRLVAFERIQYLLSFYYIQIQLFGSCASGIAIQNSDIDIAIKSQILNYFQHIPEHFRLQAALNNLHEILSTQPYLSEITLIPTASIPIIKLKIDTSVDCLEPQYGEAYHRLNRPHNSGVIQADITIETLNMQSQRDHLGIQSTQTINNWLEQIPTLHHIVITLKCLLQSRSLHKTYQGGMNNFSLILLLVSYIYHAKLEKQNNFALVLQEILKFYAFQFDQKQTGINIQNYEENNIFFNKEEKLSKQKDADTREKADLEIMDPKSKERNITRSCYKFPEIKEFFKEILVWCFEQPHKELEEIMQSSNMKYINKTKEFKQKQNRFQYILKHK